LQASLSTTDSPPRAKIFANANSEKICTTLSGQPSVVKRILPLLGGTCVISGQRRPIERSRRIGRARRPSKRVRGSPTVPDLGCGEALAYLVPHPLPEYCEPTIFPDASMSNVVRHDRSTVRVGRRSGL